MSVASAKKLIWYFCFSGHIPTVSDGEKCKDEEGNEIKADDRPMWDRFEVRPKGDMDICAASCEDFFNSLRKVTKIILCILCFILILCGGLFLDYYSFHKFNHFFRSIEVSFIAFSLGVMTKLTFILISNNIGTSFQCNGTCSIVGATALNQPK